ncbi:MAG: Cu(I)/Ag(I) efflux system membrane fusion protein, partial [Saprospiraceae bacterium]
RNQFDFLSQAMINSVKAFGTDEKTYYVQYCPMAKDNQGADWISTEKLIRNPYFGDKMMKCGSVKLELN